MCNCSITSIERLTPPDSVQYYGRRLNNSESEEGLRSQVQNNDPKCLYECKISVTVWAKQWVSDKTLQILCLHSLTLSLASPYCTILYFITGNTILLFFT